MATLKAKNCLVSNSNLRLNNGNGAKPKTRIESSLKKMSGHWDFLDEIEAPMWVDLSLESKSADTDKDDEWFYTIHLFHQSSAMELKAAFSKIGEMTVDMQQPSPPNLPPSVSRSRGKDYRNKEWVKGNQKITLDKKHPITNLSSNSSGTSDFLSALGMNRCATRLGARAAVNSYSQSDGWKSLSCKSSMGSSNPHREDRNLSTGQSKYKTPESVNIFKMSKGHQHTNITQQNPLLPKRCNISVLPDVVSKSKENKGSTFKRPVTSGKENAPRAMYRSQDLSIKERAGATVRMQAPKFLKERVQGTSARTILTDSKVTLDKKREVKSSYNIGKVFLR
ncbi:unnamed protein product [Cuscuta campestris]|uniref:Uncharacterized protein n=1 Tax=Cuscuta campestris TaxID=132261 RepID=A0A484MTE9_9ASTE|nr:unnamed protein product [Cuscuta campestris]